MSGEDRPALLNRDHVTDALRFWEPARIAYNLTLALITAAMFGPALMSGDMSFTNVSVPNLVILAALANIAYSVIYPIDLFVQSSAFREARAYWRWALWGAGTLFAAALTWIIAGAAVTPMFG